MSEKQSVTIELHPSQVRFLEKMVEKHGLPDVGKAVRCLVTYAVHEPDREDELFEQMRCSDC